MNLAEVERLVRRLEEAVAHPPGDAAFAKLATEYNSVARAAGLRLNQCAAMLVAGDDHQALQLSEAPPPLLDLLTLLAFRQAPAWRALCQSRRLAVPEDFDPKSVRLLNETYAKGITTDHGLYKEYRRAVMRGEDRAAVAALRTIARLNSADQNARQELSRLESKLRGVRLGEIETLLPAAEAAPFGLEAARVAALATEVETAEGPPAAPCWPRVQALRARLLLRQFTEARDRHDFDAASLALPALAPLAALLDAGQRGAYHDAERWHAAEAGRRAEAARHAAALGELAVLLDGIEQAQLRSAKPALRLLKEQARGLDQQWREIDRDRGEVPAGLAQRHEKIRSVLAGEIGATLQARRRFAFAAGAVVVAACLAAAWFAAIRHGDDTLAARLRGLIAERKIAETEGSLAGATNRIGGGNPGLRKAVDDSRAFLEAERLRQAAFRAQLAQVQAAASQGFTNAPAETQAAAFDALRAAVAALAPEWRKEADEAVAPLDTQWSAFLTAARGERTARLDALIDPIARGAEAELRLDRPPEEIRTALRRLNAVLESARPLLHSPVVELRPSQEAVFRVEALEALRGKAASELANWDAAQAGLIEASNFPVYLEALNRVAVSAFFPAEERTSAARMVALAPAADTALASLLLPGGPVAALTRPVRAQRVPDEVLPAERAIQVQLRDDEHLRDVTQVRLKEAALPAGDPRRERLIFLRGALTKKIGKKSGVVYDPSAGAPVLFAHREFSSSDFTLEEPEITRERRLYDKLKLAQLLDSNTGRYQLSLLQVLDELNASRDASPVFRAWLFQKLARIIDAQPEPWGALWSPALAEDRCRLGELGAEQIQSGDWLNPAAHEGRGPALAAHFETAARRSYARQSAVLKRLLPNAMKAGVRFLGHVDGAGRLILLAGGHPGPVWGWAGESAAPVLLFDRLESAGATAKTSPLPFSPLFAFAGDRRQLIEETFKEAFVPKAEEAALTPGLPPLFRAP